MIIDTLLIQLGIDPKGVQDGMNKAESVMNTGINSMKNMFMGFAATFAASAMFNSFVEGASNIEKFADTLNMSMEDLQAWRGAAKAMGAEGQEIDEMLIDMNEHLVDMVKNGSGPAVDVLKQLGISATDSAGNIRNATDVILDLAEAGERVGKQEMLAQAKIMGFDKSMISLLQMGRSELVNLLKAQKELAIYSKEDAEIAKKAKLANQGLFTALESISAFLMRFVIPVYSKFVEALTKVVVWIRENEKFAIAFVTILATVLTAMLAPALWAVASAAWAAIAPLAPFIAGAIALALAIDDLWTYLEGGESALAPLWETFINFFAYFEKAFQNFKDMWESLKNFFSALFEGEWQKAGESLISYLKNALISAKNLWLGFATYLYETLANIFTNLGNALINVFNQAIIAIKNMFVSMFDYVFDSISNALDSVTSFFGFGGGDDEKKKNSTKNNPNNLNTNNSVKSGINHGISMPLTNQTYAQALPTHAQLQNAYTITPQNQNTNNTISNTNSVGQVIINTKATDANGIAQSISPALNNEFNNNMVMASNTGVIAK